MNQMWLLHLAPSLLPLPPGRLREAECMAQNGSLVWGKGELNSRCCVTCQALQQLLAKVRGGGLGAGWDTGPAGGTEMGAPGSDCRSLP